MLFLDYLQAQVLYDFTAEPGNNELTVKEGETVTITNQVHLYQHSSTFLLSLAPRKFDLIHKLSACTMKFQFSLNHCLLQWWYFLPKSLVLLTIIALCVVP